MLGKLIQSRSWPALLASALFLAVVGTIVSNALARNEGQFVYPLDDTYIHMAMAKNIAEHGIWGVTQYGFTSSSSSPLWTLLIACCFAILGVNEWIPLVLSTAAAVGLIFLSHRLLRSLSVSPFTSSVILVALVLIMPLPVVSFSGLEHTFHALLTVLFMMLSAQWLAQEDRSVKRAYPLAGVAALLCATRYEGAFLVMIVALAAVLRERRLHAAFIALGGALPILAYGAYSASKEWFWLPTSVLLKGHRPDTSSLIALLASFVDKLYERISTEPHILALVLVAMIVLAIRIRRGGSLWELRMLFLVFLTGTLLFHLQFAKIHWFYRYEAYLIAAWLLIMGLEIADALRNSGQTPQTSRLNRVAWSLVALAALSPLMLRAFVAYSEAPQASTNIYHQQIQMSKFLGKYYLGETVVLNDIGAVGFYTDVRVMDLMGLATLDAARIRYAGPYVTSDLERLAVDHRAKIGIVFDGFLADLGPNVPKGWIRVGEWTISNNVVCGEATVSFYAFTEEDASRLLELLRSFAPEMPPGIVAKVLKK